MGEKARTIRETTFVLTSIIRPRDTGGGENLERMRITLLTRIVITFVGRETDNGITADATRAGI